MNDKQVEIILDAHAQLTRAELPTKYNFSEDEEIRLALWDALQRALTPASRAKAAKRYEEHCDLMDSRDDKGLYK